MAPGGALIAACQLPVSILAQVQTPVGNNYNLACSASLLSAPIVIGGLGLPGDAEHAYVRIDIRTVPTSGSTTSLAPITIDGFGQPGFLSSGLSSGLAVALGIDIRVNQPGGRYGLISPPVLDQTSFSMPNCGAAANVVTTAMNMNLRNYYDGVSSNSNTTAWYLFRLFDPKRPLPLPKGFSPGWNTRFHPFPRESTFFPIGSGL